MDDMFDGLGLEDLSAEMELMQRIAEEKHVVSLTSHPFRISTPIHPRPDVGSVELELLAH